MIKAESAACCRAIQKAHHANQIVDFDAFIQFATPQTTFVLLPVYIATYEYRDRSFEVRVLNILFVVFFSPYA